MTPELDDFLREAIADQGLHIYFDTTVILDLLRPDRRLDAQNSVELLDSAIANKWQCAASYFALMEALDIEQENMWFRSRIRAGEDVDSLFRRRRKRDPLSPQASGRLSNQLYRKFVEEVQDFISWATFEAEGWEQALELAMTSNMRAPDCIHLATALASDCNILITSDTVLRDLAQPYIRSAFPPEMVAGLRRAAAS
ncbi:MAG: hypothetical protein A2W34_00045 [Chloroflexi bacterium RBG_16_64_32]|nr:MAG: hypothetical protein A2W34_00045 [Chloroflexi bacterium RBG_16_64_32]